MIGSLKYAGSIAALLALMAMSGGHWLALQTVAWGRMLRDFSQNDPLAAAIVKTFDGRHPCPLCLKVQKGWQREQKQERNAPPLRLENLPHFVWHLRQTTVPALEEQPSGLIPFIPIPHSDFVDPPHPPPPRV